MNLANARFRQNLRAFTNRRAGSIDVIDQYDRFSFYFIGVFFIQFKRSLHIHEPRFGAQMTLGFGMTLADQ